MSLKTGILVHARQWTVLNITKLVIGTVYLLAADEGIDEMVDGEILFEWGPVEPIFIRTDYEEVKPLLHLTVNE